MTLWVVVANSSFAEVLAINGNGRDIQRVHHLEFPQGRERSGDILTDRPGRSYDSMGVGRHALGSKVDPHTQEQFQFAHQLVNLLHKAKSENNFSDLVIIAPPQFLGELRKIYPDTLKKCISREIIKNLPESMGHQARVDEIYTLLDLNKPKADRYLH